MKHNQLVGSAIKQLRTNVESLKGEYMSEAMQQAFLNYLHARREHLQQLQEESLQRTREVGGNTAADPVDRSQNQQDADEEMRLRHNRSAELRLIASAVSHHAEGECGYCKACGEEIGVGRMLAVPHSIRDIDCEELAR
jgi:RNA polymerase-binding protein DksA